MTGISWLVLWDTYLSSEHRYSTSRTFRTTLTLASQHAETISIWLCDSGWGALHEKPVRGAQRRKKQLRQLPMFHFLCCAVIQAVTDDLLNWNLKGDYCSLEHPFRSSAIHLKRKKNATCNHQISCTIMNHCVEQNHLGELFAILMFIMPSVSVQNMK